MFWVDIEPASCFDGLGWVGSTRVSYMDDPNCPTAFNFLLFDFSARPLEPTKVDTLRVSAN